ncbi:MAG: CHAT domain-containing protein, partial [Acidobacteriota bacterium]
TAAEARSILGLVPQAQRLLLEGFDARLDQVLSGRLAAYRIVHFATHANTDWVAERPVGLVLSQTTPEGEILDGVLGLDALYGLHLPAELAVLSACSTGAGRDVAGEGLLSLTRGFMHAGTPRVLVSLWPVRDRATRELMERFYDGLLRRCLRPPEALRLAQRQMWRLGRPQQDWAAFQLQGEWRGFEACQTAD